MNAFVTTLLLTIMILSGSDAVFAQAQNTADGINPNAREQIENNEQIEKAREALMAADEKVSENTDGEKSVPGKNIVAPGE